MRTFTQNYMIPPQRLNIALLLLRVTVSCFMMTHGWSKLLKLLEGGEIKFGDPIGIGPTASLVLVVFSEFFCSLLIATGLWTRLASIPLIITMCVAAFITHASDSFGKKELALLYLTAYAFIAITGPGKYSIDGLMSNRR